MLKRKNCFPPVIAEAGVNHNGSADLALQLAEAAHAAGADIVKFQAFRAGAVASPSASKAEYQVRNSGNGESQLDMLRRLELAPEVFAKLAAYCKKVGIGFLVTPFDDASIDMLAALGLNLLKIPSGEITNLPYLRKIGALKKEIILSTGMSDLDDIRAALSVLEKAGTAPCRITLLHCTTEYPAPLADVNLRAMLTMRQAFPEVRGIGYSDHTQGIEVSLAAAALGATVIEKHFTLDRSLEGPDHKASLEPDELTRMVLGIRNICLALGSGEKMPASSERKNRDIARKSIVAAKSIRAGQVYTNDMLTCKRPGTGLSPMLWDALLGTRAARDYAPDEPVELSLPVNLEGESSDLADKGTSGR